MGSGVEKTLESQILKSEKMWPVGMGAIEKKKSRKRTVLKKSGGRKHSLRNQCTGRQGWRNHIWEPCNAE